MPDHVASDTETIARLEERVAFLEDRLETLWDLSRYRFKDLAGGEDELGWFWRGDES